ncbi:MAG TPA: type III pantothenate kinase [Candidatus Sulfotelmatobacter sp.]|nr:type III pantothenate kinase [Candidatus Sulfotelmatobacter sp.]
MLLAINANNTNTKFALFRDGAMLHEWRILTIAGRTADEYAVWLTQLMRLQDCRIEDVDATIICTVVPQALFNLRLLCQGYFKSEPLVIGDPKVDLGIKALVDRPSEVGADRLANAVGAHVLFPGKAAVVVDFGTSTNFDVVDEQGNFCGGIISPGINLSLEALHMATAQLPKIALAKPDKVIGTNTLGCMQSGVFWGYVGLVEGLVARAKAEWGRPMVVISTGGLAPLFVGATSVIDETAPDITMRGLLQIYHTNIRPQA